MTDDQTTEATEEGSPNDHPVWVRTRDAAAIFGTSDRTIRKWIAADPPKIEGQKVNDVWMVKVSRDQIEEAGIDLATLEAEHGQAPEEGMSGTVILRTRDQELAPVDMEPMANLIAELSSQVAQLSAKSAMWQERAEQLEDQLDASRLALSAGESKIDEAEAQRRVDAAAAQAREEGRAEAIAEIDRRPWWKKLFG